LRQFSPFFTACLSKTHFNFKLAFLCHLLSYGEFHQYFSNNLLCIDSSMSCQSHPS
jgi:hypothetical protein